MKFVKIINSFFNPDTNFSKLKTDFQNYVYIRVEWLKSWKHALQKMFAIISVFLLLQAFQKDITCVDRTIDSVSLKYYNGITMVWLKMHNSGIDLQIPAVGHKLWCNSYSRQKLYLGKVIKLSSGKQKGGGGSICFFQICPDLVLI